MTMLSDAQVTQVWNRMFRAEVRALYFAELAARYTRTKQVLLAVNLLLTSGAVVSIGSGLPSWFPLIMSGFAALVSAYTIGFNIDRSLAGAIKLHAIWNELRFEYERLWNHWYTDDAEQGYADLCKRAREASELGIELPYKEKEMDKWQQHVYSQYSPDPA
jgi:hypothetical protein